MTSIVHRPGRRDRRRAVLRGRAAALVGRAAGDAARDRIYDDLIRYCRPAPRRHDPGRRGVGCRQRRRQHPRTEISASGPHHRRGLGEGHAFKASYPKAGLSSDRGQPAAAVRRSVVRFRGFQRGAGACRQPGWDQAAFVRELCRVAKRSSSACRTAIFRSSITPRSRCCTSGRRSFELGLPAARQGGMGGRRQPDSDVAARSRCPDIRPGLPPSSATPASGSDRSARTCFCSSTGRAGDSRSAWPGKRLPVCTRKAIKSLRRKGVPPI